MLLAHVQLRNTLQAQELVFLECSYFVVYLALPLTALHTLLFFKSGVQSQLVEYREGLIAKVLFWPLPLGLQLLAALVFFYRAARVSASGEPIGSRRSRSTCHPTHSILGPSRPP